MSRYTLLLSLLVLSECGKAQPPGKQPPGKEIAAEHNSSDTAKEVVATEKNKDGEMSVKLQFADDNVTLEMPTDLRVSRWPAIRIIHTPTNKKKPFILASQADFCFVRDDLGNSYKCTHSEQGHGPQYVRQQTSVRLVAGDEFREFFRFESVVPAAKTLYYFLNTEPWGGKGWIKVKVRIA